MVYEKNVRGGETIILSLDSWTENYDLYTAKKRSAFCEFSTKKNYGVYAVIIMVSKGSHCRDILRMRVSERITGENTFFTEGLRGK